MNPRAAAAAFESLAGAPVRLVWMDGERLMAFDSVQAAPPEVLRQGGRIERPLITPDGRRVVFTEDGRIHVIGWETREDRALTDGFAVAVLRDAPAEMTWVYAAPTSAGEAIFRFPLDDPTRRESIWDKGPVDPRSLQFSRDGRYFAGVFFGRDVGVSLVDTGRWRKRLTQDNALLAPDNSYISAVLDGTRRRMRFFLPNGDPRDPATVQDDPPATWQLELSSHHALGDRDVTGLRWSNRPRFLIATLEDGDISRVGIARLSANLRQIEDAACLGVASRTLSQPDGWMGGGGDEGLDKFPQAPPIEDEITQFDDGRWLRWPRTFDGIQFLWADDYSNNEIPGRTRPCRVTPLGLGRSDRWGSMLLDGGAFEADAESARAFTAAAALGNHFSVELALSESIDKREPFSTRLVALQLDDKRDAFSLSRVDQALVLRVLLEPEDGSAPPQEYQATMAPISILNNRVSHLRVIVDAGKVSWMLDGETMPGDENLGPPSLRAWTPQRVKRLIFGDEEPHGGAGWKARMDHVLIRTGKASWEELRDNVKNALRDAPDRLHPRPLRVRARLREAAPADFLATASPRVLVQQLYDVVDVVSGSYDRPSISVIHWAALGGKPVPSRPTDFARSCEMLLDPAADHPELESERVRLSARGFHLPLYFDVTPLDVPPATVDEKK
jgi:hypothetical protein